MEQLTGKYAYILAEFLPYKEDLKTILEQSGLFECVYCFTDEEEMMIQLKGKNIEFTPWLFTDYYVNGKSLSSLFKETRKLMPKSKIIVHTVITNPFWLKELSKFAPEGLLHGTDRSFDILNCINKVSSGEKYCSLFMKEQLSLASAKRRDTQFTDRELQLLYFWVRNYTIETTAEVLNLSPHTIVSHRRRMFKKAKCNTIEELVNYARKRKLIK